MLDITERPETASYLKSNRDSGRRTPLSSGQDGRLYPRNLVDIARGSLIEIVKIKGNAESVAGLDNLSRYIGEIT